MCQPHVMRPTLDVYTACLGHKKRAPNRREHPHSWGHIHVSSDADPADLAPMARPPSALATGCPWKRATPDARTVPRVAQ